MNLRNEPRRSRWNRRVYGPRYLLIRERALQRNDGLCQFCGINRSEEAHHSPTQYPADGDLRADQIIALCHGCHEVATAIRRFSRMFGDASPTIMTALMLAWTATQEGIESLRQAVRTHTGHGRISDTPPPQHRDSTSRNPTPLPREKPARPVDERSARKPTVVEIAPKWGRGEKRPPRSG